MAEPELEIFRREILQRNDHLAEELRKGKDLSDTSILREVIKSRIGGRKVIGGHTPLDRQGIVQSLQADHIMLDNGCVYKGEPGLGSLCALELNSLSLLFQENIDFPE